MSCCCSTVPVQTPIRANRSLDQKIANIRANPSGAKDFILADAKDADMAAGLAATGKDPITEKPRSLNEYRDQMREWVFFTDLRTFRERYQLVQDRKLEGFCSWVLGTEDPEIWALLPSHK